MNKTTIEALKRIIDNADREYEEQGEHISDFKASDISIIKNWIKKYNKNKIDISDIENILNQIIDYMWKDEEKNWEENGKPDNHIFTYVKKLSKYLKNYDKL